MPNIELYGFDSDTECAKIVKRKVRKAVTNLGLEDETVITTLKVEVESLGMARTQFIRVCSDQQDEISDIIKGLKAVKIGCDVEILLISNFVSAENMQ